MSYLFREVVNHPFDHVAASELVSVLTGDQQNCVTVFRIVGERQLRLLDLITAESEYRAFHLGIGRKGIQVFEQVGEEIRLRRSKVGDVGIESVDNCVKAIES